MTIQQIVAVLWTTYLNSEPDQLVQLQAAQDGVAFFTAEAQRIADEAGIELPDPCE